MAVLGQGILTFLLTDLEGSTSLWGENPDAMAAAVARHDALMGAGVAQHGGTVVKSRGEGDSIFAVFNRATESVAAALALQKALAEEPWPTSRPLRARMALHTGETEHRDGDYFGTTINRCARLRAVAHGGQVLLSLATEELIRDALPAGVSLVDLGTHRLQDLAHPERVYQLVHPDLPADFPPLRSLETYPNNLPRQLSRFIGRAREISAVTQLLADTPLLTLTGAGGCGKTRLAIQAAADQLQQFPGGAWLVELAALADPSLVVRTVAAVLKVREKPGQALEETLVDHLRHARLLLILDNCEHLVQACAQLAQALLQSCPHLRIIATSREALGVPGETTWLVPSLTLPDPRRLQPLAVPSPDAADLVSRLTQFEAVQLFIDRAVSVQPSFSVTNQNAPAVAQVCHRLDGIPLAIELAAARVKVLSVDQIAARLDDRFRLLTGGSRTALPRQQTLRALIDWSYDLLSPPERTLLRRLSVFTGGWTMDAAEAVASDFGLNGDRAVSFSKLADSASSIPNPQSEIHNEEVLDLLSQLIDKSLVMVGEEAGETRYRLLETVRQYSRDRLQEAGEACAVRDRHRDWFLQFAEQAEPELSGPDQGAWLDRLEVELDNLRAALAWSLDRCGGKEAVPDVPPSSERVLPAGAEAVLRLGVALRRFWQVRAYFTEGGARLDEALRRIGALEPAEVSQETSALLARARLAAGMMAHYRGDLQAAEAHFLQGLAYAEYAGNLEDRGFALQLLGVLAEARGDQERASEMINRALALRRESGDRLGIADSLIGAAFVRSYAGDYPGVRAALEESLALRREIGDQWGIGNALHIYGLLAWTAGDAAGARGYLDQSYALRLELTDRSGAASSLLLLGLLDWSEGELRSARLRLEASLAAGRDNNSRFVETFSLAGLGLVTRSEGNLQGARLLLEEALALNPQLRDRRASFVTHVGLATVALRQNRLEEAARLLGAASTLAETAARTLPALWCAEFEETTAETRAALQEAAFHHNWEAGRAESTASAPG